MVNKKKSFLLHIDSLDILEDLTNGQAGVLFKAIKAYQHGEDFPLDSIVKVAFSPFKNQFLRDDEKYLKTCERRAIAGSKGGKQKVANASKSKQSVANVADTKNKNKNKTKNKNDNEVIDIVAKAPKFNFKSELVLQGVESEIIEDWLAVRRKKKASNTKTAFKNLLTEISKANLTANEAVKIAAENSWAGFKANWYENTKPKVDSKDILQISANSDWHLQDQGF